MNTLIIYAHPSQESFTYQVLQQLVKGLEAANHSVEISDLYQQGFATDMTANEYEREGKLNLELPIPKDVKREHRKIKKADCIFFLYPVWWSDCPAKLKGWFDRVYTAGYAYRFAQSNDNILKMKQVPLGLVICTAGHPSRYLKELGIAESMRTTMIDDRLGHRFAKKEMIILGGTLELEQVKQKHLDTAFEIGKQVEGLLEKQANKKLNL